jgi:hypothetical protein
MMAGKGKMVELHGSGAILLSGSQYNSDSEIESGELDQNFVENGDETHFVMNMDDGKTLAAINERVLSTRTLFRAAWE